MTVYVKKFAGIDFHFDYSTHTLLGKESRRSFLFTPLLLSNEYMSSLVAESYRRDIDIKQQVLDALSPFQSMSKAWAAAVLDLVLNEVNDDECLKPDLSVTHCGSWFGQQAAILLENNRFRSRLYEQTLIDLDLTAMLVADRVLSIYGKQDQIPYRNFAVSDVANYPFVGKDSNLNVVMWTGVEHFDPDQVKASVQTATDNTLFILQGTDMFAPDHINPIHKREDLVDWMVSDGQIQYTLYFLGTMQCPYGSRHCAAVMLNKK